MTKKASETPRETCNIENEKNNQQNQKVKITKKVISTKKQASKRNIGKSYKTSRNNGLPNIQSLEKTILDNIIGQDEQVRQIITAIYRARTFTTIKSNVLVVGKSGVGKTETVEQIAKKLGIPYTIEDATRYTKEGYVGADVEEIIFNLIETVPNDIRKAQNGIVILDEIDKKVGHEGEEISSTAVLKSLLKIIEGTKIKMYDYVSNKIIDFDTKNITFILLGAFEGLEEIRDERLNKKQIGFKGNTEKRLQNMKFTKEDLAKYGMPEEFVGRIDTIVEMNQLTKGDLALILKKSKISIFRKYEIELRKQGVKLVYDEELFEHIAGESVALNTGARELSNTVNHIFEKILYEILAKPRKYTQCKLSSEIVKDNTKYQLS